MNEHILAAIRSEPWAIVPAYLNAIEAIALRVMDHYPATPVIQRVVQYPCTHRQKAETLTPYL